MSGKNLRKIKVKPITPHEQTDIYNEINIIYILGKYFMVWPFEISGTAGHRILRCSNTSLLYYAVCLVYFAITIFALVWENVTILEHIHRMFNIFTSMLCIICAFLFRKKIIKMLGFFEELDTILDRNGVVLNHQDINILSWSQYLLTFLLHVVLVVIEIIAADSFFDQIFIISMTFFSNMIIAVYVNQFTKFIQIIQLRLRGLTSSLEDCMKEGARRATDKIECVHKCYYLIWRLSKIVNWNYNVPVLCTLGAAFYNSTSYIYVILGRKSHGSAQFLYVCSQMIILLYIPHVCQICINEVSEN